MERQVQAVDLAVASTVANERKRVRMTSIVKAVSHAADKKAASCPLHHHHRGSAADATCTNGAHAATAFLCPATSYTNVAVPTASAPTTAVDVVRPTATIQNARGTCTANASDHDHLDGYSMAPTGYERPPEPSAPRHPQMHGAGRDLGTESRAPTLTGGGSPEHPPPSFADFLRNTLFASPPPYPDAFMAGDVQRGLGTHPMATAPGPPRPSHPSPHASSAGPTAQAFPSPGDASPPPVNLRVTFGGPAPASGQPSAPPSAPLSNSPVRTARRANGSTRAREVALAIDACESDALLADEKAAIDNREHMNGTHFDGCAYGGGLAVGHTALNDLVRQIAIACGAAARVAEIRLGPKDPSRPMHPRTNANQKADGLFSNWTTSASTVVWDGTIVTAVPFHKKSLDQLASGTKYATDLAEIAKNGLKAKAAKACNYEFLPWAVSSRGGMGSAAADVFTKAFAEKLANAEHEGDKWRIRNERKRFLQQLSAIVARRNYAIFHNASPRRGGEAPPAPPIDFE
jgi:hypothetical protein